MSENEAKDRAPGKGRARREKRRPAVPEVRAVDVIPAPHVVPDPPVRRSAARRAPPPEKREPEIAPTDREAVLAANALFYRAFENRDFEGMKATWAKVPYARCIHPGWEPLCGWEEIVGSWGQIFKNTEPLHFDLADVVARVSGNLAWVEVSENLEAVHEGKPARSQVLATNLFERQPDGRWRMIHHHSSPVMVRHPAPKRGGEPLH